MESNHTMSYDVDKSSERMDEILNASDNDYCDKDSIPVRSDLTFKMDIMLMLRQFLLIL